MLSNHFFYKLMLVTDRKQMPLDDYLQFIKTCASGGITSVQLREKHLSAEACLSFGRKLKEILDPLNIPLIVNDNIELALQINASGVHLGQTDGDPELARQRLGPDKIIGVSIDTEDNLIKANHLPIDYVGVGAIFPTTSKPNITTVWGTSGLNALSHQSKHPIIGIGGINESNALEVLTSGAQGIAIIAAIHDANDPYLTTQNLRHIIEKKGNYHAV